MYEPSRIQKHNSAGSIDLVVGKGVEVVSKEGGAGPQSTEESGN